MKSSVIIRNYTRIFPKILPAESLTDIVALFKYFDLGSLLLTNKQFFDLARQVTGTIRVSDVSVCDFYVGSNEYFTVYRRDTRGVDRAIHEDRYANEDDLADFVSEALPHCVVGHLVVDRCWGSVFSAIKEAAKAVIVTDTLSIMPVPWMTAKDVVDFVDSFRRVTVSAFGFATTTSRTPCSDKIGLLVRVLLEEFILRGVHSNSAGDIRLLRSVHWRGVHWFYGETTVAHNGVGHFRKSGSGSGGQGRDRAPDSGRFSQRLRAQVPHQVNHKHSDQKTAPAPRRNVETIVRIRKSVLAYRPLGQGGSK